MPTPTSSLKAFVATATKAARSAAREIIHAAENRDQIEISNKASNDFVTSADKLAEEIIIRELLAAYPTHAVLSEEAGRAGNPRSDYLWIIDPIDGTTNFIHGLPQFCVSIGLTYRGDPIAAVIYDVAKNELFTAAKGQGATLDGRRIRVSENDEMRHALIGTGFPFRRGADIDGYLAGFKRVAERSAGIRRPGSAALDLAWVACGRYDGFWEFRLKPWDICAGGLMVLEAGGLITDLNGGEDWLESGNVCAGSPKIFAQLLPLVGAVEEKKAEEAPTERRTLSTRSESAEKPARRTAARKPAAAKAEAKAIEPKAEAPVAEAPAAPAVEPVVETIEAIETPAPAPEAAEPVKKAAKKPCKVKADKSEAAEKPAKKTVRKAAAKKTKAKAE